MLNEITFSQPRLPALQEEQQLVEIIKQAMGDEDERDIVEINNFNCSLLYCTLEYTAVVYVLPTYSSPSAAFEACWGRLNSSIASGDFTRHISNSSSSFLSANASSAAYIDGYTITEVSPASSKVTPRTSALYMKV